MMFFRCFWVVILIATIPSACANPRHGYIAPSGAPGFSVMNLGGGDATGEEFTNAFKPCNIQSHTTSSPTLFDVNNYPIGTLTDTPFCNISNIKTTGPWQISWPATRSNCTFNFLTSFAVNSSSNATTTSNKITCDGVHAGFANITFNSIPGTLTLQIPQTGTYAPGTGDWIMCRSANNGGAPNDDCDQLALGNYFTPEFIQTLGTEASPPPAGLLVNWIRTMGWDTVTDSGDSASWAYVQKSSSFNWFTPHWVPGARSGGAASATAALTYATSSVAGTTPVVYTGAPSDDENNGANGQSLGAWADGEVIQGIPSQASSGLTVSAAVGDGTTNCSGGPCVELTVNSASLLNVGNIVYIFDTGGTTEAFGQHTITAVNGGTNQFTINVPFVHAYTSGGCVGIHSLLITGKASGAAKVIATSGAKPIGCSGISIANSESTFTYNAVNNIVIMIGEPAGMVPYDAQINLANKVNANLWTNVPMNANNDFITQLATLTFGNLNSNLKAIHELANEVWNSAHVPWSIGYVSSVALGINGTSIISAPYYGLRARQMRDLIVNAGWSGRRSKLETVLMTQFCCGLSNGNNFVQYEWDGTTLSPTNNQTLCTYLGGTFSGTCSGATDYSSSPDRPIDVTDTVGMAPYVGGVNLNQGPDINRTFSPGGGWYQTLVTNWVSNNPTNQATAISAVNSDMLGNNNPLTAPFTVTCSGTTFTGGSPISGTTQVSLYTFSTTGALPSGLSANAIYILSTTGGGGANNFTIKGFTNGAANASATDCGTGGSGTLSINPYPTGATLLSVTQSVNNGSNNYLAWQNKVATYTSGRPSGMSPLKMRWYEGASEAQGGTAAQYTTNSILPATVTPTGNTHGTTTVDNISSMTGIYTGMVVSAADITASQTVSSINVAGNSVILSAVASGSNTGETITFTGNGTASFNAVNDAITGWKNSASAATTQEYYYKGFMGTDPTQPSYQYMTQANSPSHLVLQGGSVWALYPGNLTTAPYMLYNGIAQFNRGQ